METVTCPNCKSESVYFSKKKNQWICEDCEHSFEPITQIKPLRLFISYGRDEHAAMAVRLKHDLEQRGHFVWFDRERLKEGQDWETYIEAGLGHVSSGAGTGKMILLMTPHSVRKPSGYCLNELALALMRNLTVVPAMVVNCEPPLSICRIHWLDMRDCLPVDANAAEYQRRFDRLCLAIEEDQIEFEGFHLDLERLLEPLEFRADILALLKKFTGRQWVFAAINDWLAKRDATRVFWITGGPGIGKSAISAWLRENQPEIKAFHFCDNADEFKRDPLRLVRTLVYQLATQLPEFAERLKLLPVERILRDCRDPLTLFDKLLVQPLSRDFPVPARPVVILIDALDEAGGEGRNEIARFIAQEFSKTPVWLRLIVTSRPDPDVTVPLQGLSPYSLDASAPENNDDLRTYLRCELAEFLTDATDLEGAIEAILQRSEGGGFLYVRSVCEALVLGDLSLHRLDEFPQGLGGIYLRFFDAQFRAATDYNTIVRPALRLIVASREPLETRLLMRMMAWNLETLTYFRHLVGSLFPSSGRAERQTVQPYHRSIAEWITDPARAGNQYLIDVDDGHRALADAGWRAFGDGAAAMPAYFIAHLPEHLAAAGRIDDLCALLGDTAYIVRAWAVNPTSILRSWAAIEKTSDRRMTEAYDFIIKEPAAHDRDTLRVVAEILRDSSYPREELGLRQVLLERSRTDDRADDLVAAILDLGKCERIVGYTKEALAHYLEARDLATHSGNSAMLADSDFEIADLYRATSRFKEAEAAFVPLIEHYRKLGNWRAYARTVRKLMSVFREESKYEQAAELGNSALQSLPESVAPIATAEIHLAMWFDFRARRFWETGQAHLNRSRALIDRVPVASRDRDALRLHGEVLMEEAAALRSLRLPEKLEEAQHLRKRALAVFEEIGDYLDVCVALGSLAQVPKHQGNLSNYLACQQAKHAVALRSGRLQSIKSALHDVGFAHQLMTNFGEALRHYGECLKISEAPGFSTYSTRGNIADIHRLTGNFAESVRIYSELMAEADRVEFSKRVSRCTRLLFVAHFHLGDLEQANIHATKYLEWESEKRRDFKDYPTASALFRAELAVMRAEEGNNVSVGEVIAQVDHLCPMSPATHDLDEIAARVAMANAYIHVGELEAAEALLQPHDDVWAAGDHRRVRGTFLEARARLALNKGAAQQARSLGIEAQAILAERSNHGQATAALLVARAALAAGDLVEATRYLNMAREKFRSYGQPQRLAECQIVEAQLLVADGGDKTRASELVEEARQTCDRLGWRRLALWAANVAAEIRA